MKWLKSVLIASKYTDHVAVFSFYLFHFYTVSLFCINIYVAQAAMHTTICYTSSINDIIIYLFASISICIAFHFIVYQSNVRYT